VNAGEDVISARPAKRSIGAAFGVAFIPAFYLSTALLAAIGPLGVFALNGLDVTSGVMTLYIMRRRGTALVSGVFVGLVRIPFIPVGWTVLLQTVVQGGGLRNHVLLTRYRRF
jgi:ABC-type thiamin/hydroxymethylpyrimidine transport system permease subunit